MPGKQLTGNRVSVCKLNCLAVTAKGEHGGNLRTRWEPEDKRRPFCARYHKRASVKMFPRAVLAPPFH